LNLDYAKGDFSIIYKGFDNLGGFRRLFGFQPNTKAAVMFFGLFHGFGLATKIQEFEIPQEGLIPNLISFNVGVELGQFSALILVLLALSFWRRHSSFLHFSVATNALLMSAGVMLVGYQLALLMSAGVMLVGYQLTGFFTTT